MIHKTICLETPNGGGKTQTRSVSTNTENNEKMWLTDVLYISDHRMKNLQKKNIKIIIFNSF